MKKTIGFLAAGYLTATVGAQGIYTHIEMKQTKQLATQQMALQQKMYNQYVDAANAKNAQNEIESQQNTTLTQSNDTGRDEISEKFKITQIDDKGYVHGEPFSHGEGIYYSIETFKQFGAGSVKVGDTVNVTWPMSAYNDSQWDDIKKIEIIM